MSVYEVPGSIIGLEADFSEGFMVFKQINSNKLTRKGRALA